MTRVRFTITPTSIDCPAPTPGTFVGIGSSSPRGVRAREEPDLAGAPGIAPAHTVLARHGRAGRDLYHSIVSVA